MQALVARYANNPILSKDDIPFPVETVHNAGVVDSPSRLRGTLTLAIDSIIKLEISRGKKSKVAVGAGIGLLFGGISGYLACGPVVTCDKRVLLAAVFAVPGAALGAIVGAAASPTIWEEVPVSQLRVSFGPQRDGRLGLGASVRF